MTCAGGCERLPPPEPPRVLEVELLETDPPRPAMIGDRARLTLRIAYRSDQPVSIWPEPLLDGVPQDAGHSGSPTWPAGEGEAIASFFLMEPGMVDAVRIHVGERYGRVEFRYLDFPVEARFVAGAGSPHQPALWVSDLQARADALQDEERAKRDEGGGVFGLFGMAIAYLIIGAVFAVLVLAAVLPWRAAQRWEGGWRVGAWASVALFALPVLNVILGVAVDPTSHNLWPFELLSFALASLTLWGVLCLLRRSRIA